MLSKEKGFVWEERSKKMTEELFCKLDELKYTIKFKSYEKVISCLLIK